MHTVGTYVVSSYYFTYVLKFKTTFHKTTLGTDLSYILKVKTINH